MDLLILPDGSVRAIYAEDIDLGVLGRPVITRASHVEPDAGRPLARRPDPRLGTGARSVRPAQPGPRGRTGMAGSQLAHQARLTPLPYLPSSSICRESGPILAALAPGARSAGASSARAGFEETTHDPGTTPPPDRQDHWRAGRDDSSHGIQPDARPR